MRSCGLSDLSTGAIADDLSKVGREMTGSAAKEGRDGSLSTFGLLREVITTYEMTAFDAWEELERTVNGRRVRFLTWSKGAQELRVRAGHAREVSDEEIAATDTGGDDLIIIDPADRPRLRIIVEVFFGVGEREGITAAAAWLSRSRIRLDLARPAPRLPHPPRPRQRPQTAPTTRPGPNTREDTVSRSGRRTARRSHRRTSLNADGAGTGEAIRLTAETWDYICEHGHEIEILHIAEDAGTAALITWLDEHSLVLEPRDVTRGRITPRGSRP